MNTASDRAVIERKHLDAGACCGPETEQVRIQRRLKTDDGNGTTSSDGQERSYAVRAVIRAVYAVSPMIFIPVRKRRPTVRAIMDIFALAVMNLADLPAS